MEHHPNRADEGKPGCAESTGPLESTPSWDPGPGLSTSEALRRLRSSGPNDWDSRPNLPLARLLGSSFATPMSMVLAGTSLVLALLGDRAGSLLVGAVLILGNLIDQWQMQSAGKAASRLRKRASPAANVRRDSYWHAIAATDIVPGDRILIQAGDRIPADGVVRWCDGASVDEAIVTGESQPVCKQAVSPSEIVEPKPGDPRIVLLGSTVVAGKAVVDVVTTGSTTCLGQMAQALRRRSPSTSYEQGMRSLEHLLIRLAGFLVLAVLAVGLLRGDNPAQTVLYALALAVGVTPEFLPMVSTVSLAMAAKRLAVRHVLVRRLGALEDLGAVDILCCDKTGTLTTEHMECVDAVDSTGTPSRRVLGFGYWAAALGRGAPNTVDRAIVEHARRNGVELPPGIRLIDDLPFHFSNRTSAVLVEIPGDGIWLVLKGAPESVLSRCRLSPKHLPDSPNGDVVMPRSGEDSTLREIAVAVRRWDQAPEGEPLRDADELGWLGNIRLRNPPIAGAAAALHALEGDGVEIRILTGDSPQLAAALCDAVGWDPGTVLTGTDIENLDNRALARLVQRSRVFARMAPVQKLRVIEALRSQGRVVGFFGDGANDAPALHGADVGISAAHASDVARECAGILLLRRELRVLHTAVMEARRSHVRIRNYLLMSLSSNFGNILGMAAAVVWLPHLPMLPAQMLLNNFLYDIAQTGIPSDEVGAEPVRRSVRWETTTLQATMLRAGGVSACFDLALFGLLEWRYRSDLARFHTGWFLESLLTQVLVVFIVRSAGNGLHTAPGAGLIASTILALAGAVALTWIPWGRSWGFARLDPMGWGMVALATVAYLATVLATRRHLFPAPTR